jgi:hypothetical protein
VHASSCSLRCSPSHRKRGLRSTGVQLAVGAAASMASDRPNCRMEHLAVLRGEFERPSKAASGVAIGMRYAAFELLNSVHAQPGALSQLLLCEPGRETMVSEQIAKCGRRLGFHGWRLKRACVRRIVQR